ncbi:MAG: transposase [Desulfobacterales bacterium]
MVRVDRHFLPGQIWHLTHRCHQQEFLLKFVKDRQRWLYWLFQAKKRYGLKILNYMVTSNHIHLLVLADAENRNAIPESLQLIAGQTAQDYNRRKNRKEAFWEDHYHATAIQNKEHLKNCIVYMDLNMVRAGVVRHPGEWEHGGFAEIQNPPKRYGLIDFKSLIHLIEIKDYGSLKSLHRKWIDDALKKNEFTRESKWTENIAVGDKLFIEIIRKLLGIQAKGRKTENAGRPDAENALCWNFSREVY